MEIENRREKGPHTEQRTINFLILLRLHPSQLIAKLFQRGADEFVLLPQVRGQEGICVSDSGKGCLERVLEGLCRAGGGGVDVRDTSQLEQTLDSGGGDETSSAGSGD